MCMCLNKVGCRIDFDTIFPRNLLQMIFVLFMYLFHLNKQFFSVLKGEVCNVYMLGATRGTKL